MAFLTPKQRTACRLVFEGNNGQGMSVTEAAKLLNITPSAVSQRISGAERRLHDLSAALPPHSDRSDIQAELK